MAAIKIPDENITLTDTEAVTTFLAARGIDYERWAPEHSVDPDAPADAILAA